MRALYSLLMWLAQPLLKRKLRARAGHEPGYGHAVEQRFGHYDFAPETSHTQRFIWLHAVSLGETRAAAVLIAGLRARFPGMRLLLTHGTATGWEQGTALLQAGDVQVWQPWDTPGAVRRFLSRFQPRIGLLMETEVWPNMVAACKSSGIPLCLVNARMSEKSAQQAQRLAWLSGPAYRDLAAVWAQTEDDARRLRALGATVQAVTGNLKFDATPNAVQLAQGRAWRASSARPVVMFASSREGEEQMLVEVLARRSSAGLATSVQWLIVPRHPQRFEAVASLLQSAGLSVSRRSTWPGSSGAAADADADADPAAGGPGAAGQAAIWLGDSLGEMALYFGLADAALLGGSFAPLGGQNLIEAAACGCPVLMGPHTFNFAQAAEMAVQARAALCCQDLDQAVAAAQALVHDPLGLGRTRQLAFDWSLAHRGATERTLAALAAYVGQRLAA
jgi:3-deoxy-D-manno-octulosonic-acid transferase